MREYVDRAKLEEFMRQLGQRATSPGTIYLTGGATALLLGIRDQTVDINIKLDPEPGGAFVALRDLKESLRVNMELAAPDQFIPPAPGWHERCKPIVREGKIDFRHYDFYSQALAKIERGSEQDLSDVSSLLDMGLILPGKLKRYFNEMKPGMIRYPAVDESDFERKLVNFLERYAN